MDVATRFQPRARGVPYMDREGSGMPEDSSGESETNPVRRKFQRTATDPTETTTTSDTTFRKPSLPASATRPGLERGSSLTQKRRSTLRENMRVPSGPREFPSPGKRLGSTGATTAASITDSAINNTTRSFLPHTNSDSFFYNSQMASSRTRLSFGKTVNASTDDFLNSSPTTSSRVEGSGDNFDFLPDVNFDDFQTSIKNYDGGSPLLSDFPTVDGGRILPKEDSYSMARSNGFASTPTTTTARGSGSVTQRQEQEKPELSRTQSLRQRLIASRQNSGSQQTGPARDTMAPMQSTNSSLRGRRQSSVPQASAAGATVPTGPSSKPPRKSVGPGLITSMMKTNSSQHTSTASSDSTLKPALARNSSLSKARRTTMQPSTSASTEGGSRISTLTATTQSRQNKVKSLQPPPRDHDLNSTPNQKAQSKGNQNRAHTPSSSGNRRQSMASGRASGLGARTISPTDARRLKRMSVMNPPPMPTATLPKGTTPTPQDEISNPLASNASFTTRQPELPRLAQPSPSLIPRKTSNATPSSARASPEGRQGFGGGVSVLSSKSSYSSLIDRAANGSTSRLPTPKPRSAVQSSSSMAQYGDEGEPEEFVPPVPAIPKAYESPKDLEAPAFFSSSLKSSQSGFSDSSLHDSRFFEGTTIPSLPWASQQTPRTSLDVNTSETPRKRSGEHVRPTHKRNSTLTNGSTTMPAPVGPPRTVRAQPDPNGRKNANLQPLRLPPLNLMPINTRGAQQIYSTGTNSINLPRPSQETDSRDEFLLNYATPEPKRGAKTPSTPMTASKATFFRSQRHQEDAAGKALRSSSSHYALRDLMGMDSEGNLLTRYWDEGSDVENAGVPIPYGGGKQLFNHQQQGRNAITPFSSGSLPKGSGEFGQLMGEEEYTLGSGYDNFTLQSSRPQAARLRAQTGGTISSIKSSLGAETPMSVESPVVEPPSHPDIKKEGVTEKKESAGGGLRRKLSLGWKRSSSKAASHAENKEKNGSPQTSEKGEKAERAKLQKQRGGEMLPPKLPASATWSGDVPLAAGARPSLDASSAHVRRKSQVPTSTSSVNLVAGQSYDPEPSTTSIGAGVKTRSQHSEQPTPVTSSGARASSWGNLASSLRSSNAAKPTQSAASVNARHNFSASSISAIVKDKDDFAADDEMQRLSRKRKDVDTAARESEDLKKRALARTPVSAEHVLHDRRLSGGEVLNVFERGEIVDYEKEGIYFTGTKAARKIIGSLTSSPQPPASAASGDSKNGAGGSTNFGYDDERGDYNIILGDHLAYRYEVVDVLGKGSFGQVVRCVDHRDGGVVAIKIIRNKKRFHQQALVEVGILGRLREWDPEGSNATLSITSSFYFRSHLCIVTPCLSINLYELIRAHNFVGFSLPLIRRFARQLLACLTLLQTKRIIHCDLKPENILLCEARKADVRVIDFGSSCREEEKVYTYIQSRFYRSPEVILGSSYGLGIDMWSLGCILAELWTGYPIFPGENEQEQLACIMEIFGPPDRHLVERCTRKKLFFDSVGKPRVTVSSKGRRRRPSSKTLQQALKTEDEAFVDFIARCLRWDPDRRLKPSEAVGHPFITNQPFHQRPGIPDEARRAARLRNTAAVPAAGATSASTNNASTTNGGIPSPVKRGAVGSSGNAFAQQQQSAQTPVARERSRPLPETPQTALRNGAPPPSAANNPVHGSPGKPPTMTANRRHSQNTTAGAAAAMAGNKRASNGAVLGSGLASASAGAGGAGMQQQQRGASGSLAQMAARESMGAAGNASAGAGSGTLGSTSAARWRS